MKFKNILFQIMIIFILISCNFKKENALLKDDIIIENSYARIIPYSNNGAIYLDIINNSKKPYKLLEANSDIASKIEFHLAKNDKGVMKMIKQNNINISAKSTLNFKLANLHLMLIGVNQNLQSGDEFKLNLKFNNNLEKNIIVKVDNDKINNSKYIEMMHNDLNNDKQNHMNHNHMNHME